MAKSETILSMLLILVMLSVASLGTFAYFNDVETVGQNVITAGTLDLTVNDQNPCTEQINADNIYPGWSGLYEWELRNIGTLPGKVSIEFSAIINQGELGKYLEYRLKYDGTQLTFIDKKVNSLSGQTLQRTDNLLNPNEEVIVSLFLELPLGVGNIVQGDSVEFSITFHLDQAI